MNEWHSVATEKSAYKSGNMFDTMPKLAFEEF
jgi:hypothetical protein